MTRALLGSVVGTVILTASTATANGVSARAVNTWSTDGYVNGAAAANGVVYIGGSFSSLGPNTGALAVVDRATNLPIDWPRFTGGSVANLTLITMIVLAGFIGLIAGLNDGMIDFKNFGHMIDVAFGGKSYSPRPEWRGAASVGAPTADAAPADAQAQPVACKESSWTAPSSGRVS